MTLACFTNHWSMLDIRSCTVKDQHIDFCDGFQHRYVHTWDAVQNREVLAAEIVSQPRECTGCLPHDAEHGMLCWHCWEKLEDALRVAQDMITHLRSVERAQQVDNGGIRSSQSWILPVPNTWRTADELLMLLGAPAPGFPSTASIDEVADITDRWVHKHAESWVSTQSGAEAAIRFYRLMQTAMAQHPMKEYEHRVRNVRCYKCRQRTLLWKPPLMFEGDVRVECTNSTCAAVVDQVLFERLSILEETAPKKLKATRVAEKETAS